MGGLANLSLVNMHLKIPFRAIRWGCHISGAGAWGLWKRIGRGAALGLLELNASKAGAANDRASKVVWYCAWLYGADDGTAA